MKIVIDEDAEELEVRITCKEVTEEVLALKNKIQEFLNIGANGIKREIKAKKNNKEYYIELKDVLFFESYDREVIMHTANDCFSANYRLYELERLLPITFIRVAKSTIVNAKMVYDVSKNLVSSGTIEFKNSDKQAPVSRGYYKVFIERMEEVRR